MTLSGYFMSKYVFGQHFQIFESVSQITVVRPECVVKIDEFAVFPM